MEVRSLESLLQQHRRMMFAGLSASCSTVVPAKGSCSGVLPLDGECAKPAAGHAVQVIGEGGGYGLNMAAVNGVAEPAYTPGLNALRDMWSWLSSSMLP
jgi:hypothetical protein